jgi:hypothetical protein
VRNATWISGLAAAGSQKMRPAWAPAIAGWAMRWRARRSSIQVREMTNMQQKIRHEPAILRRPRGDRAA